MMKELNSGKLHIVKQWAGSLKEGISNFDFMTLFASLAVTVFVLFAIATALALVIVAIGTFGAGGVALIALVCTIWGVTFSIMKGKI